MLCHRFDRWVNKFDLIQQDLLIVPLNADNTDNNSDNSDGDGYVAILLQHHHSITSHKEVMKLW